MILIRRRAFARAALVGNPSDGYHGRTIALIVRNFRAEVVLYEWDSVDIVLAENDRARFRSVRDLARDVTLHGYYGGIRLIKATIKRFVEYCDERRIPLHDRNFSVRYETTIPRQVGLAGSSAIIVATLRCLMEFYGIDVPLEAQPSLVLSVEREELGITAGLQDRVVQVHEGLMHMDFSPQTERLVAGLRCYAYERLDPALLPPLYLAYHHGLSEPTEVFHDEVRGRFERGDQDVVRAMKEAADLAGCARRALLERRLSELPGLIDRNFDLRRQICHLPRWQVEMVDTARRSGASANFAGSGGAIVGTYDGRASFDALLSSLRDLGCSIIEPQIAA
ncbi:MAG: GHMP kinase [Acidobacteria bacterium]|nr:GHMP kinase [Acidobacteriota bacterium]MBI3263947.1 GHMP kinase [Acidobacteriota bacterium]